MLKSIYRRSAQRLAAHMRSLRARTEGVAAVEFALIVPIMSMMFIGAVEMSQAITANRHVTQVSGTVGDLVARSDATITNGSIGDIMNVGAYLLAPYSATTLKATITVVGSTSTSATTINTQWFCEYDGTLPGVVKCNNNNSCLPSAVAYTSLPAGLITQKSDYAVITKVTYGYKPPVFDVFMKTGNGGAVGGVYTMTDTVYLKPRALVPQIVFGAASNPACPLF